MTKFLCTADLKSVGVGLIFMPSAVLCSICCYSKFSQLSKNAIRFTFDAVSPKVLLEWVLVFFFLVLTIRFPTWIVIYLEGFSVAFRFHLFVFWVMVHFCLLKLYLPEALYCGVIRWCLSYISLHSA